MCIIPQFAPADTCSYVDEGVSWEDDEPIVTGGHFLAGTDAPSWKDPEPPTWICEYCDHVNRREQLTCGAGKWSGCGAARP